MNPFKSLSAFFLDIVEIVVVAASIFLVVYLFFMQPHQVNGQSMEPTLINKEYVLTDKVSYQTGSPRRGDVVVFHAPESAGCTTGTGCDFIKRVIGLPGDTILLKDDVIFVNGEELPEPYLPEDFITPAGAFTRNQREVLLGENEYFVVGDNREYSSDSRAWGPIPFQNIVGRAFMRYLPIEKAGIIPRVQYPSPF